MSKYSLLAKFASYSCVLLFALFVVGCGGGYSAPPQALTISITPATAAMATGQSMLFAATGDSSGVTWSVSSTAATPGTIDASGNYTAPSGAQSLTAIIKATSKTNPIYSSSVSVNVVAPGVFTPAPLNVQVTQYTISPAAAANVSVQFGLDTSYGLTTWTQPAPAAGGAVSLFVAGMKQSTLYHMRGVVAFADGSSFNDADQTFTTGAVPVNLLPTLTATTTAGMTPQSGVELLDLVTINAPPKGPESVVTDLAGNVLWVYQPTLTGAPGPNPIKLLPNGHFLIGLSGQPDGSNGVLQEVDLGSNVIWQMTTAQLNTALAAATCSGCHITILGIHHDFAILPNGHLILIAATTQVVSGVKVTGDVLIDLDQNHNPVWLWNEFDHLDITRQPYMYPDWTHTNAILYSATDGNLVISIRHQNWVLKIDYNNGAGAGDILWHLGYQGDFTLLNSDGSTDTTNTDWFFAQHGPSFVGTNTSGKFSMVLFDNGDDRGVAVPVTGGTCGVAGQPACFSTVPIFNIDETAKTATFAFHPTTPDYSWFGGNAEVLANGNVEYNECGATLLPANNSKVFEVTQASPPVTVWQMNLTGQYAYRAMRIPSLYPGVQW